MFLIKPCEQQLPPARYIMTHKRENLSRHQSKEVLFA